MTLHYVPDVRFYHTCDICGRELSVGMVSANESGRIGLHCLDLCPTCMENLKLIVHFMRYINGMVAMNYKPLEQAKNLSRLLKFQLDTSDPDDLDVSEARKAKLKARQVSKLPRRYEE